MKVLKIIRSIFVWLMVALAVFMMIFTIVSVSTFDRADRNLFGYKAFIVLSDSMSKTDFNAGDLVLVKEVDPSTLKEGDIIAYTSQNTSNYGETVTHKIRKLTTDANGEPGFVTYGTTTDTDDETVVTYPYVLGKYSSHIPKVGTFFQLLKTTPGYIVCILIPFLLLNAIEHHGVTVCHFFLQYCQWLESRHTSGHFVEILSAGNLSQQIVLICQITDQKQTFRRKHFPENPIGNLVNQCDHHQIRCTKDQHGP